MRQILYVSSKTPQQSLSISSVLAVSRRNNDAAGVTGLLYTDGSRFLQVLEGESAMIDATFERIKADPRHRAIVILADREIDQREFGLWSMAHRLEPEAPDEFDERMSSMLANASPSIRATFLGLVSTRRGDNQRAAAAA